MIIKFPDSWERPIKLRPSEDKEICLACSGEGRIDHVVRIVLKKVCDCCIGDGKVHWTENVIQKEKRIYNSISADQLTNKIEIQKENIRRLLTYVDSICLAYGFELQAELIPRSFSMYMGKNNIG